MKKSKVTAVVATKNEENNIGRLLESIKKQSYSPVEIVVVDNNSNDQTKQISRKYASKLFNIGPERSAQRNYGVRKSTGKYVLILDADMELTPKVIESCVDTILKSDAKALIVPERTTGDNFIARVRRFERDMYQGDSTVEVARFFDKRVFVEMGGYDEKLTGAEDYDLPARIMKKYKIGWAKEPLLHHEGNLTLRDLVRKKYYYASQSVSYADKHPELVAKQGTIIFRRAYVRHWKKFFKHPLLGVSFIVIRLIVTFAAVLGYVRTAGLKKFIKTFVKMFSS